MADENKRSPGPLEVGMMALHDRAFFERLLTDPRGAMTDMVKRGQLRLTDADMDEVVRLVETGFRSLTPAQGLAAWDSWHETGQIRGPIWPGIIVWPA
jgi:hypothetical protein